MALSRLLRLKTVTDHSFQPDTNLIFSFILVGTGRVFCFYLFLLLKTIHPTNFQTSEKYSDR
jgi:hypothetical protein